MPSSPTRSPEIAAALRSLAESGAAGRGSVYTMPAVARMTLGAVGYRPDRPLHRLRLLEPSFGEGAFLLEVVERLLDAWLRSGGSPARAGVDLQDAVRGVELNAASVAVTRELLARALARWDVPADAAARLLDAWLIQDDFLLADLPGRFDVVVGNPPYVRQERIPAPLLAEYRRRYRTIFDRADLYVPFFERGLDLLAPGGQLGFVCADRWMKNRFGGPLREKVARGFQLLDVTDLSSEPDAFRDEVMAYAAITVLRRPASAGERAPPVRVSRVSARGGSGEEVAEVVRGADPWLLDDTAALGLLRRLERDLPALEQAGARVGIGVATGCDRVFIGDLEALPVEEERKLPLVLPGDLRGAGIRWSGKGLVNPFEPDGTLASLTAYPRFGAWVERHREAIAGRFVARKNPRAWYRTIDRVHAALTTQPKLLVPDIQGAGTVVLDPGRYYPHHNLYFVVSDTWDLRALRAVLCSSVALLFVSAYSVKMSGGFLRFQAQVLRRVRVPRWEALHPEARAALVAAGETTDQRAIDQAAFAACGLSSAEADLATRIAEAAHINTKRPSSRGSPGG